MNEKKIAIITNNINCERLVQYYAKIEMYLKKNGWNVVREFDVQKVIIAGCGFHDNMYDKIMKSIEIIKENGIKEEDIILVGCTPKTHESKLATDFKGDVVYFKKTEKLDEIIDADFSIKRMDDLCIFNDTYDPSSIINMECFFIKILDGCLQKCTFCVIKKVKGFVKSRKHEDILSDFHSALDLGYKKIFLMGEDTFAYGYDNQASVVELIDSMLQIAPDITFFFGSLHCRWIIKYQDLFIKLCKNNNIQKIFIGLQHVNPALLSTMGREPNFDQVYRILKIMKKMNQELNISADILVGFPGETDSQFQDLYTFFKEDDIFDLIHHYGYSDVTDSESSHFDNKISSTVIALRWNALNEVLGDRSGYNNTFGVSNHILSEQSYQFCEDTYQTRKVRV